MKGIAPNILMLCFVVINIVILNILCLDQRVLNITETSVITSSCVGVGRRVPFSVIELMML